MTELDKRKCVPCEGGLDALTREKAESYLKKLDRNWILNEDGKSIERTYSRKNHYELSSLINSIIAISHSEDHHPEIILEWGNVTVSWWSHKIKGLHKNDFICASKTDDLFKE